MHLFQQFHFFFHVSINFFQIWECVDTPVRGVRDNHHHHYTWVFSGHVCTTSHLDDSKRIFVIVHLIDALLKNIMFQPGSPSPSASTLMNNLTSLTETTRRPAGSWATTAPNLNITSSTASRIRSIELQTIHRFSKSYRRPTRDCENPWIVAPLLYSTNQ